MYVLCDSNVRAAFSPCAGLPSDFHGPQMEVDIKERAAFGSQPVQPDVISIYLLFRLMSAGASLCPAGAIVAHLPVNER